MLVTMKEMLADAKCNHYAIPAFDVSNYEMMKAVLETCEEERSPALLMGLGVDLEGRNLNLLTSMVKSASEFFNVPVCFHLDHATDLNFIKAAIDSGFSSVMYDGSVLPFEENAKKTAEVVNHAHKMGVTVEAELVHVGNAGREIELRRLPRRARRNRRVGRKEPSDGDDEEAAGRNRADRGRPGGFQFYARYSADFGQTLPRVS